MVVSCFVEAAVFSKRVFALGLEDELRELQKLLSQHPEAGAPDAGTGGLRKIRMRGSDQSKGKRSGARVHYLYFPRHGVIHFVYLYEKRDQGKPTVGQKASLKAVVDSIKRTLRDSEHR